MLDLIRIPTAPSLWRFVFYFLLTVAVFSPTNRIVATQQPQQERKYTIKGTVFGSRGQPVPRALIRFQESMGPWERTFANENGEFEFGVDCRLHAIAFFYSPDKSEVFWLELRGDNISQRLSSLERIELVPATSIAVTVRQNKQVIQGASVVARTTEFDWNFAAETTDTNGIAEIVFPTGHKLDRVWACQSQAGIGGGPTVVYTKTKAEGISIELLPSRKRTALVLDQNDRPLAGIRVRGFIQCPVSAHHGQLPELYATTNEDGIAEFDWVPADMEYGFRVGVWASQYDWDHSRHPKKNLFFQIDPGKDQKVVYLKAKPNRVQVQGKMDGLDLGKKKTGIRIAASGFGPNSSYDQFETTADSEGRFSLGLYPGLSYVIGLTDDEWACDPITLKLEPDDPDTEQLKIKVYPAVRLTVKVTHGKNKLPITGINVMHVQTGKDALAKKNPTGRSSISQSKILDETGRVIFGSSVGRIRLATGLKNWRSAKDYFVVDGQPMTIEIHAPALGQRTVTGRVLPPETELSQKIKQQISSVNEKLTELNGALDADLTDGQRLEEKQRFLTKQLKKYSQSLVKGCEISVIDGFFRTEIPSTKTANNGDWSTELDTHEIAVLAISHDGKYGGFSAFDNVGEEVAPLQLAPTVKVTGKLLDRDGEPMEGVEIVLRLDNGREFRWTLEYGTTKTDEQGCLNSNLSSPEFHST